MKKMELMKYEHAYKVGDDAPDIEPNITEDTLFLENGEPIGFYMKKMPPRLCAIASLCDIELRSKNVPKSVMNRSSSIILEDRNEGVVQYSTIIGSIPPKAHMRRPYPTISSVHNVKSAEKFIKAMRLLAHECEALIKQIMPEAYERQCEIIREKVPEKYRFGNMFTSSISNYNISASYHRDNANLKDCLNVIIVKKQQASGGNTTVPDYNATVDSCDNSILVYPAWKNLHAVTPIVPKNHNGYRNSLVFYPLASFEKYV